MKDACLARADAPPDLQATTRDTPPKDVCAEGRFPGSRVNARCLAFPVQGTSDTGGSKLTTYSCGGSSGITLAGAPASLLAPGGLPEEPCDGPILRPTGVGVKKYITILLYANTDMRFGRRTDLTARDRPCTDAP